ncbi:uncharacterized protein LOC132902145 [Amyelois transitella]|uniref:uncharacterized protein LOC132902145 n=1 Tax=Amyelois transitella TaxID=680683 RepID=UPI00298F9E5A|nr:uncharacterized protein LOC132902145 [Amyelois transitella]
MSLSSAESQTPHRILRSYAPVFTTSRYGKPVIQMGRYRFNKSGNTGWKTHWYCVKACMKCKAKIVTKDDEIIEINALHNHQ